MKNEQNTYLPFAATVLEARAPTPDVTLFTIETERKVTARPGQFFMVSVFGAGEVPISVASAPDEPLMLCIRRAGRVTSALLGLRAGEALGLRGPLGNGFSLSDVRGRDVIIMAGGLGIVPLRPLVLRLLKDRGDYGRLSLLYGSRTPSEGIFMDEAALWINRGLEVVHTVDCAEEGWSGCVGLVTTLLDDVDVAFSNATAFVCGPPVMIGAAIRDLAGRGVPRGRITTTLEAHMKCGVGKCGHCYKGPKYICTDGPVFSMDQLEGLTDW